MSGINVEISNELIEKLVGQHVEKKVHEWFNDPKSKSLIREKITECVGKLVDCEVYRQINNGEIDFRKLISEIPSEKLAENIIDRIERDMASFLEEKYG